LQPGKDLAVSPLRLPLELSVLKNGAIVLTDFGVSVRTSLRFLAEDGYYPLPF